jgi:hypothetical protein
MSILHEYSRKRLALATAIASTLILSSAYAEPSHSQETHEVAPQPAPPQSRTPSFHRSNTLSSHATLYYQAAWGIDKLRVRRTASGTLVRFSYRVTDAERAQILGEKEATPHLVAPQRGVMLQVPVMEKVGQLRQTGTPVVGKEYWMVFSNKGDVVKAGDRVDVLIGNFHADGLLVE